MCQMRQTAPCNELLSEVNGRQLLSQDDETIQAGGNRQPASPAHAHPPPEDGGARLYSSAPQPVSQQNEVPHGGPHGRHHHERSTWTDDGDQDEDDEDEDATSGIDSPIDGPPGAHYVKPQAQRQLFERQCTRTILLANLAEGTTHADITNAVRGGMLLDVFLRSHERCAAVSFLHSADARKFYEHVRRHDLYIRNKRVRWSGLQELAGLAVG